MTFSPTEEQLLIKEAAKSTSANLLINALAGAAKTSTLVLIGKTLYDTSILTLAFNKKISLEMKERLTPNCQPKTLNGLGHQVWGQTIGKRLDINKDKTYEILSALVRELPASQNEEAYALFTETKKAIEEGKTMGYIPSKFAHANRIYDEDEFFASLTDEPTDLQRELIIKASELSVEQAMKGIVDFNDQILLPTVFPASFPNFPLVMVDEAQDLSALNHLMLTKAAKKRLIAVGDPCQPLGTLITKVKKKGDRWNGPQLIQIPIEDIQEGDTLLGHNANGSFMFNRRVEGITRKSFEGNLVVAGPTRYTPNHHCYTRFSTLSEHWCVYLMKKGASYRLGKSRMSYGEQGLGPQVRAKAEGADAMWILATYENETDAFIAEAVIQTEFGLSDLCFVDPLRPWLASFWLEMETLNLESRARACLSAYHREFDFPLYRRGDSIPVKRPFITRACNLLSGCEFLSYEGEKATGKDTWKALSISYEPYSGDVISFTISDNHLYVADGVVTHNCQAIYGFRGAHENSMSLLREQFSMNEFTLSISFRCPRKVVEAARWRAPMMRYPDWAEEGEVKTFTTWSLEDIPHNAAVICRNNAPLFRQALEFIKAGRYPQLLGNDIGKALLKIMKKFGKTTMPAAEVFTAISAWKDTKMATTRSPGSISDQAECLNIFAEQGETLGAAIAYAETLFASEGPIKMMTIHRAKGLEFDHVFILNKDLIRKGHGQEDNLLYVAITRAKKTLNYITIEGFEK